MEGEGLSENHKIHTVTQTNSPVEAPAAPPVLCGEVTVFVSGAKVHGIIRHVKLDRFSLTGTVKFQDAHILNIFSFGGKSQFNHAR